uniref:Uncharacterized protein n=1 Tax=Rhizophora mucronata TaxID=61149 RepID=A0A2P2NRP3_RHIMU
MAAFSLLVLVDGPLRWQPHIIASPHSPKQKDLST